MKKLIKIATALCLLGTCQLGFAMNDKNKSADLESIPYFILGEAEPLPCPLLNRPIMGKWTQPKANTPLTESAKAKLEHIYETLLAKLTSSSALTSASTSSASTGTAQSTIAQSAETIATGSSSSISNKKKINILWSKGEDCRREYNCINKLSSGEDLDVNINLAHWLTYFNKPAMVAAIFAFANQIQKTKSL